MGPKVVPLASLRVSRHLIPSHGPFPNCGPTSRPLTIYHSAFADQHDTRSIQTLLSDVGVVQPQWVYSMYREHHYHSTTHEVLVVANGSARLCFGGLKNPDRVEYNARPGDVMVLPAGIAHALLEDTSDKGSFQMVGSYPVGADSWDHCTADSGHDMDEVVKRIKGLKWFERDPIYGATGPILD